MSKKGVTIPSRNCIPQKGLRRPWSKAFEAGYKAALCMMGGGVKQELCSGSGYARFLQFNLLRVVLKRSQFIPRCTLINSTRRLQISSQRVLIHPTKKVTT